MMERRLGCDIVVALGAATTDGQTLWGKNSDRPRGECQTVLRVPGRRHAGDEKVHTQFLNIPQARETYSGLGSRPDGIWGFEHGVNEHQLVVGNVALRHKLPLDKPGLTGMDLVRLVLERCRNVSQAIDLLTHLVQEHGQGSFPGCLSQADYDNGFLIADPHEAVVLEAAGRYWVLQDVREARALSNVTTVRQDWDRISAGLAGDAIARGWWQEDGSKLDFAAAVAVSPTGHASAMRRWGRATLLLEQQNGRLDHLAFRRILSDHYENVPPPRGGPAPLPLCCHDQPRTAASMIAQLSADPARLPIAWCAFGPPCQTVFLPLFLEGPLPESLTGNNNLWHRINGATANPPDEPVRRRLDQLQALLDQEAESFAREAAAWKQAGDTDRLSRLAGIFMQHAVERVEDVLESTARAPRPARLVPT